MKSIRELNGLERRMDVLQSSPLCHSVRIKSTQPWISIRHFSHMLSNKTDRKQFQFNQMVQILTFFFCSTDVFLL